MVHDDRSLRLSDHRMASPHVTMRLSSLPRFKSLLVHGPYNPFAPIRLSLSVPPPHHTIFFTPSRHSLLQALQTHDDADEWLHSHSGTGTVAGMSSRVTVLLATRYPHVCTVQMTPSAATPIAPNTSLRSWPCSARTTFPPHPSRWFRM